MKIIQPAELDSLLNILQKNGYKLIGPTINEGAIIYDEIHSVSDLPCGWRDVQEGGKYRLERRNDNLYFGYVVGPQSLKKFLFPAVQRLWQTKKSNNGFEILPEKTDKIKYAFIGVRSCDLDAIQIQDKIFIEGKVINTGYKSRRDKAFILAVNCVEPGGNCFCTSMGSGPKASKGFDLCLTEMTKGDNHLFLIETGSKRGEKILSEISSRNTENDEIEFSKQLVQEASLKMGKSIDALNTKESLLNNFDHHEWEEVAKKCLSCANCTMVCPTCFCVTIEDTTDLTGEIAERWQKWDSCFTLEHSYIHGGSIRSSTKSRYRQWLMHKLSSWYDQFGTSGCVGCGRCITWCPVGIDITVEAQKICESKQFQKVITEK